MSDSDLQSIRVISRLRIEQKELRIEHHERQKETSKRITKEVRKELRIMKKLGIEHRLRRERLGLSDELCD